MTRACDRGDSPANEPRICYEKYLGIWFLLQMPDWQTDTSKRLAIKAVYLQDGHTSRTPSECGQGWWWPSCDTKVLLEAETKPTVRAVVLAVPAQQCACLFSKLVLYTACPVSTSSSQAVMGPCDRWLPAHGSHGLLESYCRQPASVAFEKDAGSGWDFPEALLGLTIDRQILSLTRLQLRKDGVPRALQLQ